MRATNRAFKPNLQRVTLFINGRKVRKTLCTKCIKSLAKTS
ncbi:L28 family ribosomal protein [Thermanaerothrix sp. 4228-RoL]|uniref:L28 family ribosomal protein n=2 Tax=Thermanaerothrix solaris TaxID=3058434 RepID=A0ABU3NK95_9CHLR|nr:L28 family ribosomal protein [Thermanaerothrix sp. 4228-RoL]